MQVISCLLEDETFKEWFSPPPPTRLNELHFRIASLVERWEEEGGGCERLSLLTREFVETLREADVVATAAQVLFGVTADSPIALPYDFRIAPATQNDLGGLISAANGHEVDILRIPARPAILAAIRLRVSRQAFGGIAGMTAIVLPVAMLEGIRFILWLATGVFCGKGDCYISEESRFPVARLERRSASVGEMFPSGSENPMAHIDANVLYQIVLRHEGAVKGLADAQLVDDIVVPLWTASTFLDAAVRSPDKLLVQFLCYSALEGMMTAKREDESRLGRRVARLIGRDTSERRRIRTIVGIWRRLRGSAAHGRRGEARDLLEFTGSRGDAVDNELATIDELEFRQREEAARGLALGISRRAYLTMLHLLTGVSGDVIAAGMTRNQVIDLLESAERNNADAIQKLDSAIPSIIRDIAI